MDLFIWPNIEDHLQIVRFVSRFLSGGWVGKARATMLIGGDASVFGFNFKASANPANTKLTQTSATAPVEAWMNSALSRIVCRPLTMSFFTLWPRFRSL
jgi:hypothetical protein